MVACDRPISKRFSKSKASIFGTSDFNSFHSKLSAQQASQTL